MQVIPDIKKWADFFLDLENVGNRDKTFPTSNECLKIEFYAGETYVNMQVVGKDGCIEFAFALTGHPPRVYNTNLRTLGIEYHWNPMSKSVPAPFLNTPVSHNQCPALNGPCYHEGTSLWASEFWQPMLVYHGPNDVWYQLRIEYEKTFGNSEKIN